MDIRAVQQRAWANKLAKGFNIDDVALEFGLLTAEVSEAFTAWRERLPDLGEELADILIYLAGLAQMTGIDLGAEVENKLAKNDSTASCAASRTPADPTAAFPMAASGIRHAGTSPGRLSVERRKSLTWAADRGQPDCFLACREHK